MLFLLRQIRRKLIMENKFTVYLLYAVGEIFLVVIGILIAVSIDDWNKEKEDRKKEINFLKEIRVNLQEDTTRINQIIQFDSLKLKSADHIFKVFGSGKSEREMLLDLSKDLQYIFSFQNLFQSRVAFDNMVSSESISIVSDSLLRIELSRYYDISFVGEERVRELTRNTRDLLAPMLWNKQNIKYLNPGLTVRRSADAIRFFENPEVFSKINGSRVVTQQQLLQAKNMKNEAMKLVNLIDQRIADN